jgi:hypothetical protein
LTPVGGGAGIPGNDGGRPYSIARVRPTKSHMKYTLFFDAAGVAYVWSMKRCEKVLKKAKKMEGSGLGG